MHSEPTMQTLGISGFSGSLDRSYKRTARRGLESVADAWCGSAGNVGR